MPAMTVLGSPEPAVLATAPPAPAPAPDVARVALDLQAALLQGGELPAAAQAAICRLAEWAQARRVSLALVDDAQALELIAISDGRRAHPGRRLVDDALAAALAEAVDQARFVEWPAAPPSPLPSTPPPCITAAHRAWITAQGGSMRSLPLVHGGAVIGAIGWEWAAGDAPTAGRETLEHLAAWMSPALALRRASERPWRHRLRAEAGQWLQSRGQPQQRRWRAWAPVLAGLALLAALWPVTHHIGGPARLEGVVQRVMSAPADGFIQQVHARPGETVRAGQPLIELADRDLQLERQRWSSQLAQHQEAVASAQAQADRAALALHQARADEAQAQLDLVEERLARARLVAPFDAIVVQGDWAQQLGAPVKQGTELMTVAPQGAYRVVVEVDERELGDLRLGQHGTLVLSALPWQSFPVQVTRVVPVARAVDGRNVFEVEAVLATPPADLRPGLTGQARLDAGRAGLGWQVLQRLATAVRLAWWRWVA